MDVHELMKLDAPAAIAETTEAIRTQVHYDLGRRGAIVAISGGIDSSVVAALCVEALGREHVIGLMLPERDSSEQTLPLSQLLADHLGIRVFTENITPILDGCGCYRRRDEAIQSLIPDYGPDYKSKLVNEGLLETGNSHVFSIVVEAPDGTQQQVETPIDVLMQVVAATNFKQRTRKMLEYYYADRFHYAVTGTPNRLEYELGFFVKNGDGAADLKPVAHLYKSHVFQLARHLGLPQTLIDQTPTTDTYSLTQTQEEFYFAMPLEMLDLCLFCKNSGYTIEQTATATELTASQVEAVFADIVSKRTMGEYLRLPPLMVEKG
ncbi:MAG: NAD(+) synthase [Verrucomicrobia bacterium]|nr:NAD(+) synthase [Verrucomicrobiota bacterium]MBT7067414.1 NAD(+) synthase [Verrucomicrobiota bacterium]MBT7700064.1 NAD(+) synthase [Verrucomicrobiota bacterium]